MKNYITPPLLLEHLFVYQRFKRLIFEEFCDGGNPTEYTCSFYSFCYPYAKRDIKKRCFNHKVHRNLHNKQCRNKTLSPTNSGRQLTEESKIHHCIGFSAEIDAKKAYK